MSKRLFKNIVRTATCLLLLIFLGVAVVLYTETGRVILADAGLKFAASGLDYDLRWNGLHSPEPSIWTIDEFMLSENGRELVNLSGIQLDWWPGTLVSGKLIIDELQFNKITVHDIDSFNTGRSGLPQTGIYVIVHSFSIDTLTLSAPGPERHDQYQLAGDLELFSDNTFLAANTVIRPATARGYSLSLSTTIRRDGSGMLSGRYTEQPQGPAGNFLRLPAAEPFELSFHAGFNPVQAGYELNIRDLAFNFHGHDVEIQGSLLRSGSLYAINRMNIDIDASRQVMSGNIDGENMDLDLTLDSFPLEVLSAWTNQISAGSGRGHMYITGTVTNPYIEVNINASTIFRNMPVSVQLAGSATRERLSISEGLVTSSRNFRAVLTGDADLTDKSISLSADLENLAISTLRELDLDMPDKLEGDLNGRTSLTGPLSGPEIEITARFQGDYAGQTPITLEFRAAGRPFQQAYDTDVPEFDLVIKDRHTSGRGRFMLSVSPLNIDIDNATFSIAGASQHLSGKIEQENIALDLQLADLPLDVLSPFFEAPLKGTAGADIFIGGTVSDPEFTGSVNSNLEYETVVMQLHGDFYASETRVDIKKLNIESGESRITAEGIIDLVNDKSNLKVDADDIDMTTLRQAGIELPDKLTGRLNSKFTLKGGRNLPIFEGNAGFEGNYQEVPVTVMLDGGGSRESFRINKLELNTADAGFLSLRGNYNKEDSDFSLEARDLPVKLLRYKDWEPPAGLLSADLKASGNINKPRANGKLVFTKIIHAEEQSELPTGIQADVQLAENRLEVLLALTGDASRTGNIMVSLPWRRYIQDGGIQTSGPLPLYGTVKGEAWLQEICPWLLDTGIHQCGGRIQADLSLGDTVQLPDITGTISISNGLYENIVTGTNLYDLNAEIKANGKYADIIKATATDGEHGTFKLSGGGQWAGVQGRAIFLELDVTDSHILRRYDMDGTADGTLSLSGDRQDLYMTGTLDISPFTLLLETFLQEDIPELNISSGTRPARSGAAPQQERRLLPVIHLDVGLAAEQQAFLRGPGLEAELQGQLTIQGSYEEPVYRGSFRTIRGSLHVLGKRFDINQGELRLENDVFSLLIPATYTGKDLEVRSELSGTEGDLKLSLSSTPSYPEDEIISRLLFGKSSQDISPLQAVRLANAITMFKRGGKPLFDPLGKIEKTLSVDRLTVEDNSNGNGMLLGVGKYIHEKVYVEVETGTSAGETWQGNVEIELLPNLNLENSVNGESGFSNMGLKWKKDY